MVQQKEKCTLCNGEREVKCPACKDSRMAEGSITNSESCSRCGGRRKIICPKCNGSGNEE